MHVCRDSSLETQNTKQLKHMSQGCPLVAPRLSNQIERKTWGGILDAQNSQAWIRQGGMAASLASTSRCYGLGV